MNQEIIFHPWGKFLKARADVIDWLKIEYGYPDDIIAMHLSMDAEQVRLIRSRSRET